VSKCAAAEHALQKIYLQEDKVGNQRFNCEEVWEFEKKKNPSSGKQKPQHAVYSVLATLTCFIGLKHNSRSQGIVSAAGPCVAVKLSGQGKCSNITGRTKQEIMRKG